MACSGGTVNGVWGSEMQHAVLNPTKPPGSTTSSIAIAFAA